MVLYFTSFNEINPQLFFVLNKFTAIPFIRSFKKANAKWYFFSVFSMKEINSSSLFVVNSQPYLLSGASTEKKSPVVLYFNIFNETYPQLFFVLKKFTDLPFIRSFNKINHQWYFISAFSMKSIHSSFLF